MPMRYQIDVENSVVLIQGEGQVSDEEMIDCVANLRGDPNLTPTMPTFADVRGIESKITRQGVQRLVDVLARTAKRRGPSKAAVLVSDPLSFGMARMLSALADEEQPETRVFEDEDAAHDWLAM